MTRGPDGSQDPGRQAVWRGACMELEGEPGWPGWPREARCSCSTLALSGGGLGFSSGHLRHSHQPQVLATPREARDIQTLAYSLPSVGSPACIQSWQRPWREGMG